ncbi:MAG TPA: PEGA domain-containing protein [Polyangiaceae bacterium]|jgi:tetratricopeptide (TPR) repeat protein|nr:PEGA domain-containing protein [Polyangiaceae bacterium]
MNLRALAVTPLLIGSLVTVPAFADAPAVPASAVTEDVTLQAREHFAQATKLYKDGDFDAALVQFERAYELKPNYKVLYNIGQTYFQLREYVEARDSMARYVKEGGDQIDVERLAAVNKDLADLERRLAKITLTVNVSGATVLVDGKKVGVTPLSEPIVVSEGQRAISVEAPNRGVLQRQIRVAGGDQQVLTLTFEDAPRTVIVKTVPQDVKPRLGAGFWATAIGAVALGAGAGVTGYFAFQAQDDNRRQKKEFGVTPSQLSDSNNRAKSLALTTDILSGAALVCAGVATVILVTSPSHPRSASLGLNVGLGSAELSGWF